MPYGNEPNKMYYVYAKDDINIVESIPELLFEYTDPEVTAIDGNIAKVGEKYQLFYVAHEGTAGIKQAVFAPKLRLCFLIPDGMILK